MAEKRITLELTVREEMALAWFIRHIKDLQAQGVLSNVLGGYTEEIGRINAALNAVR